MAYLHKEYSVYYAIITIVEKHAFINYHLQMVKHILLVQGNLFTGDEENLKKTPNFQN